ncbi:hypothetical protein SynROS8604_02492 [Synechococcus sp. ROS8604]|nr:hypothetical protein SynROS8604_02492 [Synechococcus sp. ROS8604]
MKTEDPAKHANKDVVTSGQWGVSNPFQPADCIDCGIGDIH